MKLITVLSVLLCVFVLTVACNKSTSNTTLQTTKPLASPTPIAVTAADLAKLKWIEGTWRGTGDVQQPFYERYHFENPSTLVMEELANETASTATRTTRYELKDGKFGNERYVATALDDKSITFWPLASGRNSFKWQNQSKDSWTAILTLPATATTPAKETVYKLERIR